MLPRKLTRNLKKAPKRKREKHWPKPNHQFLLGSKCSFFFGGWWSGRFSCKNELFTSSGTPKKWGFQTHNEVCRIWHRSCLPNVGALWCGTDDVALAAAPPQKKVFFFVGSKRWREWGLVFFFPFFWLWVGGWGMQKWGVESYFWKHRSLR